MFFYQGSRLTLINAGAVQRRIVEASTHPLAVIQEGIQASLLATDVYTSVLLEQRHSIALRCYTPYGLHTLEPWGPRFTGQVQDVITEGYLLGNGYRLYSPKLMRFYSADSWSPFGKGGINAYGYGAGDPVNGTDPTGHMFNRLRLFWKMIKYHDAVAAGNAEKIFLREGKHLIPPSEINLRQELDRRVVSAQNNLIKHRHTLSTLPDEPQYADQRAFAKKRIAINQEQLNKEVRTDLKAQKRFFVGPSTKYTYEVGESGDIKVEYSKIR
ncbi:RHS repeat-associated core domain-containing protein [Pseudomonas putida]|uniref:RHS repeat-associated core domain-containing protein n=1 Tax=Pseudomonas putida TaxID=303 RepID=UPI0015769BE7|nr:RHS repeat-associated core domain-containing protein [Pseudomonas putida]NTY92659.1 RHS repeat-associated core domain-containing protein [Pseudomonas putida]NTZ03389.1 RHS repeat-associated core domain-containing protein [Pseudomonas putida]NTZ23407.1 RHS repeat-associated core domain-containing protein [Pseudomonas putida]NTZ57683.1 RHS repeat-associated core domain-containing protein [Pseudomonas putida]NTZ66375.1 RHS repeat-associated core domain-containing protein [Pseudomonas putida]